MQKRLLFLVAMMLTLSLTAMAQITTSSMAGKVTLDDQNGEEVIGATVVAIHEPSGTRYTAVTNTSGRFTIQGMRTGGPYEVTVSYIGFQPKTVKGIVLQLAETYNLSVTLSEDATELAEVVVSGKASKFAAEKTGAATNINSQQITNLPTVSRSITDVTRLSPYGGNGMSFAGADGRTANFTVDGANFNNNFGLSSNLPGGGNPISIDAIEELQVVISPYDVRQTNFIGGGVNAITKSGTNTFKGSAYIYHKNENMQGDAVKRQQIAGAREKSQTTTYGFTFGGPIIKNKLFFFVNGEMIKIPSIVNRWRGSENGVADANNYISRTTNKDLEAVSNYVKNKYGYNTGSWTSFPADESNYKLMARLDWNINDKHKVALRYNYTKNNVWNSPNATSMDGGTRMAGARMSQYSMSFANSMYSMENIVHSWSLDLNSRLTENLSNQFLATISKLDDIRGTNSSEFPFIDITKDGDNYMALGYELFTWNNAVHNTIWNIKDDVTYYMGAHKIMAGITFEHQMADNQYMRNGSGYYRYNLTDDMYVGGVLDPAQLFNSTPEIFCLTYGYDGETKPAARVQFNRPGIYAQDEWNVNDKFKLTYGLRVDGLFFNNSDLMTNNAILALDYDGRHIDTGKWPKNSITFSPRVGFTYDVFGDKSLKVRGGTGLFSGRLPLVFFTNMPQNAGMIQSSWNKNGFSGKIVNDSIAGYTVSYTPETLEHLQALIKPDGTYVTNVNEMIDVLGLNTTVTPEDGQLTGDINGVDPNFRMPQIWKSMLGFDWTLPVSFPLTFTVEGMFNKTLWGVRLIDWNLKYDMIANAGDDVRFNGPDKRVNYRLLVDEEGNSNYTYGSHSAYVLTNSREGYGYIINAAVSATPFKNFNLNAAYTHTESKEISGMPGSAATSAYSNLYSVDGPSFVGIQRSQYVVPNKVTASVGYMFPALFDGDGIKVNLFYTAYSAGAYSYVYSNDMNGDGMASDLMYIPKDVNELRWVSDDDKAAFQTFMNNDPYLSEHKGQYAEAYAGRSPWRHLLDARIAKTFKKTIGNTTHNFELSVNCNNLLNMFNSSWGLYKYTCYGSYDVVNPLKVDHFEDNTPVFSMNKVNGEYPTETFTNTHINTNQCWALMFGLKYSF